MINKELRLGLVRLGIGFVMIAVGFILGGVWTRWLLAERLFQTGTVFAVLAMVTLVSSTYFAND